MKCKTAKNCYISLDMAEEALLENWSRNHYSKGSGPVNVYQCEFCGYYHFTSKGPINDTLKSSENVRRIKQANEASFWEDKYKRRR